MSTEEPEKPDELPPPKKSRAISRDDLENPYVSPNKYDGRGGLSRPPTGLEQVWRFLGMGVVVALLILVVGFGLLVGCCALAG